MAGSGTAHMRSGDRALSVENLIVEFPADGRRTVHAVSGVSFDLRRGETLGLVGESGCGKSSTARAVLQLPPPTGGSVICEGTDLTAVARDEVRRARSRMQVIFQDPRSALNPRRRVREIVARGRKVWFDDDAIELDAKVDEVLQAVGLDPAVVGGRRPGEFSGGQCQRICIARALILEPTVLICDEPVSALDVSVQAQILNLLQDMRDRYGLTMLFISHDLGVIKNVSDRVLVMYLGKVCEVGPVDSLFAAPAHHYTSLLLDSVPKLGIAVGSGAQDRADPTIEPPSPLAPPQGCRYRTRCPAAQEVCAVQEPVLGQVGEDHYVACHFPLERSSSAMSIRPLRDAARRPSADPAD